MKIFKLLVLYMVVSISLPAQILKPVKWSFTTNKLSNNEAELLLTAKIDQDWHLYSQTIPSGGPIATSFKFNKSPDYTIVGKTFEPKAEEHFDENFDMKLKTFSNKVDFKQKVKLNKTTVIKGTLEFMCCDNKQCLPPDEVNFEFQLTADNNKTQLQPTKEVKKEIIKVDTPKTNDSKSSTAPESKISPSLQSLTADNSKPPANNDDLGKKSLLMFFIISLIAGFAGTITPCVFPMIPMSVSYFLNSSGSRRKSIRDAMVYGISIILIYTLIGVLVSLLKADANTMNTISTHWITNMSFFLLFIIFAASFFGLFEMTLPSWMVNKSDKNVDKGGMIGAFFMALTLVLVAFSCTGPIIGAILVEASGGEMLKPIIGMFGFGLAFSLPFMFLALFPSMLGKLPKSGGWLGSVKIVMGFIILALSMKFFVMADQTYHWNILSRDVFIAIWIVLFSMLGMYLLGKLKFAHDSDLKHISVFRLLLAIISFTFVIYLIPGIFGAPLKLISGFLPPANTLSLDLNNIISKSAEGNNTANNNNTLCEQPKYSDILHLPYNLHGYFDYKQGLACAKKLNKPIFIAFTGHACGNCHKMENDVWSDPEVLKRLKENYIVIVLYTDDRTELPKNEWTTSTFDGKVLNTIGKLNADLRIKMFNTNSQPFYVLLDSNEKLLTQPHAYDVDVANFVAFLDKGIK